MKPIYKQIKALLAIIYLLLCANSSMYSQCNNGNLEAGNLNYWTTYTGVNNDGKIHIDQLSKQTINGQHTIVGPGTDNYAGFQLTQGTYSLRLGNDDADKGIGQGSKIDIAGYTFTVTNSNKNFAFKYALVLQDPISHQADQKPGFSWFICRTNGDPSVNNLINAANSNVSVFADRNNPFFKQASNDVVYRPWTNTCIDLSAYIGETLTIFFASKDCSQSAHFGYVYIDGLCENNEPIPSFEVTSLCYKNIVIDASNSQNEDGYFLQVMQSDANWSDGPEVSNWFLGKQAGVIDIKNDLLESQARTAFLKCNTYYRITLAVRNDCVGWAPLTKLVYVGCVDPIADVRTCYENTNNITLGTSTNNNNCTWVDNLNNWVGQGSTITIPPPRCTTTYKCSSTDVNGCYSERTVTAYIHHPAWVSISKRIVKPCCNDTYATLRAEIRYWDPSTLCSIEQAIYNEDLFPGFTYQWSTGETTRTINTQDHPGMATFTVTITNGCGSASDEITIDLHTGKNGSFPDLIAPNSMTPGHNDFIIMEFGPNAPDKGTGPAYNATGYKLEIFDRWGGIIRTIQYDEHENFGFCNFLNGDIRWDGRTDNGTVVQTGTYTYMLNLYNCTYNNRNGTGGWKPRRIYTNTGWVDTPNGVGTVNVIN